MAHYDLIETVVLTIDPYAKKKKPKIGYKMVTLKFIY
jgi:hypothetical protein